VNRHRRSTTFSHDQAPQTRPGQSGKNTEAAQQVRLLPTPHPRLIQAHWRSPSPALGGRGPRRTPTDPEELPSHWPPRFT
jgi:hypothetical protein